MPNDPNQTPNQPTQQQSQQPTTQTNQPASDAKQGDDPLAELESLINKAQQKTEANPAAKGQPTQDQAAQEQELQAEKQADEAKLKDIEVLKVQKEQATKEQIVQQQQDIQQEIQTSPSIQARNRDKEEQESAAAHTDDPADIEQLSHTTIKVQK